MEQELKEAFEHLLHSLRNEDETNIETKLIDEVDRDLLEVHERYIRKKKDLFDDIEMEKEKLEIEANQKIKRMIRDREEDLHDVKRSFWDSIYKRYDLDPNKRYKMRNKELFLITKEEN